MINKNIELREIPEVLKTINAILENDGIAEVKLENGGKEIVVVETNRKVKIRKAIRGANSNSQG